jgi:hypothetical protein
MGLALNWLAEPVPGPFVPRLPGLEEFMRANAAPGEIGLGSCVRVSLSGGWALADLTREGVIIEVVPPGRPVRSAAVAPPRATRSSVTRYVVQCRGSRVVRPAGRPRCWW